MATGTMAALTTGPPVVDAIPNNDTSTGTWLVTPSSPTTKFDKVDEDPASANLSDYLQALPMNGATVTFGTDNPVAPTNYGHAAIKADLYMGIAGFVDDTSATIALVPNLGGTDQNSRTVVSVPLASMPFNAQRVVSTAWDLIQTGQTAMLSDATMSGLSLKIACSVNVSMSADNSQFILYACRGRIACLPSSFAINGNAVTGFHDTNVSASLLISGTARVVGYFRLGTTPADFGSAATAATLKMYNFNSGPSSSSSDYGVVIRSADGTLLAAADSGGTAQTIAKSNNNSVPVQRTVTFTYVNSSATRAQWDDAWVVVSDKATGSGSANWTFYANDVTYPMTLDLTYTASGPPTAVAQVATLNLSESSGSTSSQGTVTVTAQRAELNLSSQGYLDLRGAPGDYASTPDHASLDLTNIEVVMRLRPEVVDFSAGLINKQDSYRVIFNSADTQVLNFGRYTGSAWNQLASSSHGWTADQWVWWKQTRVASTGVIEFYKAADQDGEPSSWTLVSSSGMDAGSGFPNTTTMLEIGSRDGGGYGNIDAKIKRVIIRDGPGGTVVFDSDFRQAARGMTLTEATGKVITINGGAVITGIGGGIPGVVTNPPPTVTVTAQIANLALTELQGATTVGAVTVTAQIANLALSELQGTITTTAVTTTAQIANLALSELQGTLTSVVTITAQIANLALSELQGATTVGAVTVTAQIANLTLTPQPGAVSVVGGAAQTITAQIANLDLSELQGAVTIGAVTITAQIANLALSELQGATTVGAITVTAQIANLALDELSGTITTTAVTVTAQIANLALTALPGSVSAVGGATQTITAQIANLALSPAQGSITGTGITTAAQIANLALSELQGTITTAAVTVTAQLAQLSLSELQGPVTVGAVTVTAQIAALAVSELQGSATVGPVTVTAQIANLALSELQGSISVVGGAVQTINAQIATVTLTPLAGAKTTGTTTLPAQIATAALTAIPGSISVVGGATQTVLAQIATLNLLELPGVVSVGSRTTTAQVAHLALTPAPGALLPGPIEVDAQLAMLVLVALAGRVVPDQKVIAQLAQLIIVAIPITPRAAEGIAGASAIYVGTNLAQRVYAGDALVWAR